MTPAEIAAMVVDADDWFRVNGNHPVRGDELAKHVRALAAECARLQRSVDVNIELRILGGRAGTDFIKQRDQAESRAAEARDKSRRAAQIIIEEIGSIGPEDGDEAAKRSVAEIRKMRAQLEAVTRERDRYKAALEYIGAMSMDEAETQAAEKAREALKGAG